MLSFQDKRYSDAFTAFDTMLQKHLKEVDVLADPPSQDGVLLQAQMFDSLARALVAVGQSMGFPRLTILAGVCLAIETYLSGSTTAIAESQANLAGTSSPEDMERESVRVLRKYNPELA